MASSEMSPPPSRPARRRARRGGVAAALAASAALVLTACTSAVSSPPARQQPAGRARISSSSPAPAQSSPSGRTSSAAAVAPVTLTTRPAKHHHLNPLRPITVTAAHGTLTSVKVVNEDGKVVKGAYSADHTGWHTAEVLGYGRRYTVTAKANDSTGEASTSLRRVYRTVVPDNMTLPYFDTIYGTTLQDGGTYGVGMIPVVRFDESIPDRAAAEKALEVTTEPHVDGSWTWLDDSTLHWRPRHFYAPGTKVTIKAMVYGKNFGTRSYSLFGESDRSVSFKIGAQHVSVANAKTDRVKVYFGGKLVRNMPTSMGRGGTVPGKNGQKIYLWTMPGTYTVIGHENPARMCSDSYGLPANSPNGYPCEKVPWSTKISTDGIYLHELDTTIWAQGHQNVSHGCLNLNHKNARWFYTHSLVGDVVKVVHSGGPGLQLWQGGDWSVPWSTWTANSALS